MVFQNCIRHHTVDVVGNVCDNTYKDTLSNTLLFFFSFLMLRHNIIKWCSSYRRQHVYSTNATTTSKTWISWWGTIILIIHVVKPPLSSSSNIAVTKQMENIYYTSTCKRLTTKETLTWFEVIIHTLNYVIMVPHGNWWLSKWNEISYREHSVQSHTFICWVDRHT